MNDREYILELKAAAPSSTAGYREWACERRLSIDDAVRTWQGAIELCDRERLGLFEAAFPGAPADFLKLAILRQWSPQRVAVAYGAWFPRVELAA